MESLWRKLICLKLSLAILLILAGYAHAVAVSDDFSTDSGLWTYKGMAYRDAANGYVVLTSPVYWTMGQLWLNTPVDRPFVAKFRYRAGGGTGADGFVLMFYKQTGYVPDVGGSLGFTVPPHGSFIPVPGYGIEFDNYYNGWISENHIALIKDTVSNHLIAVNDMRTEDFLWHDVAVTVDESSISVSVDGGVVFTWTGSIDRTYAGLGFTAATGALNNWHIIDDVSIQDLTIKVKIDIKPGSDPNCFNNNKAGIIPVAILGSADFNVQNIDPATVALNGLAVKAVGKSNKLLAHYEDVNADGFQDLVVQIEDSGRVFAAGDTAATLTGNLYDGRAFEGTDAVCIVR